MLIEFHQSPKERARIGAKMAALVCELAKSKVIEPSAPKEPTYRPKISHAALDADLAAIRARNTPERLAAIEAALATENQDALIKALAS